MNIRKKRLRCKTNVLKYKTFKFIYPDGKLLFKINYNKYLDCYNRKEMLNMVIELNILLNQ